MIFIIKGFRTIVFIFIVISTTFRLICPLAFFGCLLSKFLRGILVIFIIKGFRTIVFIFIVISTTLCPPLFFRCLSNSGNFTELQNIGRNVAEITKIEDNNPKTLNDKNTVIHVENIKKEELRLKVSGCVCKQNV